MKKLILLAYSKTAEGRLNDVFGLDSGSNFVGTWLAHKRPAGRQSVAVASATWLARTAATYSPSDCIVCGFDVSKLLTTLLQESFTASVWLPYWLQNEPVALDLAELVTRRGNGDFIAGAKTILTVGEPQWVGRQKFGEDYRLHDNIMDDFLLSITCAVRLGLSFNVPEVS